MMKKYILSFTVILLGLLTQAQSLEKGPVYEGEFSYVTPSIIGEDENHVYIFSNYILKVPYTTIRFEGMNKTDLSRTFLKEFEQQVMNFGDDKRAKLRFAELLKGDLFYFMEHDELTKKEDDGRRHFKKRIVAHRVNGQTGEKMSMDTILDIDGITLIPENVDPERWFVGSSTRYYSSKRNKRLLIVMSLWSAEMDKMFQWLYVYDESMSLVKTKEIHITGKGLDLLPPMEFTIDDEGMIYYLEDNELVILDYFNDYEAWSEPFPTDIFESNAFSGKLSGAFDPNGDLVITASYVTEDIEDTEETKKASDTREGDTQVEGVIYLKINTLNKEFEKVQVSKFDKKVIGEFITKQSVKNGVKPEIDNVYRGYRYLFDKDKTYVMAEDRPSDNTRNDLFVYSFDQEGSLVWAHRVPRFQRFNPTFTVFGTISFLDERYLYIFFNEHPDNFDNSGNRDILRLKSPMQDLFAQTTMYRFDKVSGEFSYQAFPDWNSGKNMKINPNKSLISKDGIYAMMCYKKEYQLVRIAFD